MGRDLRENGEKKMTKREFYTAIVNGTINDELVEFAQAEIAKLDGVNAKRAEKAAEKAVEREAEKAPIREAIYAVISTEAKTASTLIAEAGVEIKPQAIPSLLKPLVEAGKVEKTQIKVTGKGKHVGYVRAEA